MFTYAATTASSALTPSQGAAEAWAGLPVKVTATFSLARYCPEQEEELRRSGLPLRMGNGCTIRLAVVFLYAPPLMRWSLPPPPSSAGVPRRRTV